MIKKFLKRSSLSLSILIAPVASTPFSSCTNNMNDNNVNYSTLEALIKTTKSSTENSKPFPALEDDITSINSNEISIEKQNYNNLLLRKYNNNVILYENCKQKYLEKIYSFWDEKENKLNRQKIRKQIKKIYDYLEPLFEDVRNKICSIHKIVKEIHEVNINNLNIEKLDNYLEDCKKNHFYKFTALNNIYDETEKLNKLLDKEAEERKNAEAINREKKELLEKELLEKKAAATANRQKEELKTAHETETIIQASEMNDHVDELPNNGNETEETEEQEENNSSETLSYTSKKKSTQSEPNKFTKNSDDKKTKITKSSLRRFEIESKKRNAIQKILNRSQESMSNNSISEYNVKNTLFDINKGGIKNQTGIFNEITALNQICVNKKLDIYFEMRDYQSKKSGASFCLYEIKTKKSQHFGLDWVHGSNSTSTIEPKMAAFFIQVLEAYQDLQAYITESEAANEEQTENSDATDYAAEFENFLKAALTNDTLNQEGISNLYLVYNRCDHNSATALLQKYNFTDIYAVAKALKKDE